MIIELPDIDLLNNKIDETQIRCDIALLMYERNIWSAHVASNFCKTQRLDFMKLLAQRKIALQHDVKAFWQQELHSVQNLILNDSGK